MQIGFVGLGKMGMNMVARLQQGGHQVIALDTDAQKRAAVEQTGAVAVTQLPELVQKLSKPRLLWLMVPAGDATQQVLDELMPLLDPGDVIVDGGNSYFRDSLQRAETLLQKGIHLLDAGTSGGVWGLKNGYCLMVGGHDRAVAHATPAFVTLAPPHGFLHAGPSGAGHYAKMVHNAIEYGMMQAYGEGFAMLQAAQETMGYQYDLPALGALWNQGSVIRSWLLELLGRALQEDPQLDHIEGYVQDSGEGRWTAKEAIDAGVPAPVLTLALQMRFASRLPNAFSARVCAALRNQFGGHAVKLASASTKKDGQ